MKAACQLKAGSFGACRIMRTRRGPLRPDFVWGLVVCALLVANCVAGQLREGVEGHDSAVDSNGDGDAAYFTLRASHNSDATEEFLDEIYPNRPSILQALASDLSEEELIASIQDPSNFGAATQVCQLGNLCAAQGNDEDAMKCYQYAAESFDIGGMYNYASSLLRGRGCSKDVVSATAWFREAAAMVCDGKNFVKRHLPSRLFVSETPGEEKEELLIQYDSSRERVMRVEDAKSGRVVWDNADGSQPQEGLEEVFRGLHLELDDLDKASVSQLPAPAPIWAGYREAVIDVGAMLDKAREPMSVDIDFERGLVHARNADGSPRQLSTKETLAALLLQVSLNRGKDATDEAYTEVSLLTRRRCVTLSRNRCERICLFPPVSL